MHAESPAAFKAEEPGSAQPSRPDGRKPAPLAWLAWLTAGAILVHGYHPFAEDAEIYLPGIKKLLHPELYPYNDQFFRAHARMTFFPNLIAGSARLTRLGLDWTLVVWQFLLIFLLLVAAWKLGRLAFGSDRAPWGSAILLASLLTLPVAGTALYIMDQYVNTRSFSTTAALWILLWLAERRYLRASGMILLTALIHPLMAIYSAAFAAVLLWQRKRPGFRLAQISLTTGMVPLAWFGPLAASYREALASRPYFFPLRWAWYEWLGVFGPLAILVWFSRIARRRGLPLVAAFSAAALAFTLLFLVLALIITLPPQFLRLVELQPMRSLEIVYLVLLIMAGGFMAEAILGARPLRWLLLFAPLCFGMFYAQRRLFLGSPHLEWPGIRTENPWVEAFLWIRGNTPISAYFALDPEHMRLPGEDHQGFRAVAERSMLADRVKDSGAVTMFPSLATDWLDQVRDEGRWKRFGLEDFARLKQKYGVDWFVLEQPGVPGLSCPYRNRALVVCRLASERPRPEAQ